jgi:hypothetical protein
VGTTQSLVVARSEHAQYKRGVRPHVMNQRSSLANPSSTFPTPIEMRPYQSEGRHRRPTRRSYLGSAGIGLKARLTCFGQEVGARSTTFMANDLPLGHGNVKNLLM